MESKQGVCVQVGATAARTESPQTSAPEGWGDPALTLQAPHSPWDVLGFSVVIPRFCITQDDGKGSKTHVGAFNPAGWAFSFLPFAQGCA